MLHKHEKKIIKSDLNIKFVIWLGNQNQYESKCNFCKILIMSSQTLNP